MGPARSITQATGPVTDVAIPIMATLPKSSTALESETLTPSVWAASCPSTSVSRSRPRTRTTGATGSTSTRGATSPRSMPDRLPDSQRRAVGTSYSAPYRSTADVTARISACVPRPMRTNLPSENPPSCDRPKIAKEMQIPPTRATGETSRTPRPNTMMAMTATVLAPDEMPMTSGLARGFPSTV